MRMFTKRKCRISAVTVAGAVVLASCGVGGASGIADLSEADKSRIAQEFSDCLAEGGLEGSVTFDGNGIGIDISGDGTLEEDAMLELERECEQLLENIDSGGDLDPEDQARLIDAGAEIQKCMADQGYVVSIDDPGGIESNSEDQPEDFDHAEMMQAEEDCLKEAVPDLWAKYGEDN